MPWKTEDVPSKTKKARTPKAKRQWVDIANSMLERGEPDGAAVRAANGVVAKEARQ